MDTSSDQELHFLDESTLKNLQALMKILEDSPLSSMRYEHEKQGVRHCVELSKESKAKVISGGIHHMMPNIATNEPSVIPSVIPSPTLHWVRSPLVGTAYLFPKPGAPAFIKVGDRVEIGAPLLIVEAMKVMNTVKSSVSGCVQEIHVTNGNPVEYDEILIGINTSV
jgi:acetyl-CoA carboxylase biotin carboxyl carrier protein